MRIEFNPNAPFELSSELVAKLTELNQRIATFNNNWSYSCHLADACGQLCDEIVHRKAIAELLSEIESERKMAAPAAEAAYLTAQQECLTALKSAGLMIDSIEHPAVKAHATIQQVKGTLTAILDYTVDGMRQANAVAIEAANKRHSEIRQSACDSPELIHFA